MEIKKKFGVFVHVTIDTDSERVLFEIAGRKAYFPLRDIKMNLEKEGFTSWELNVASGSLKEEFEVREEAGLEIIDWVELAQTDIDKLVQIHQAEREEKVKRNVRKKKPPLPMVYNTKDTNWVANREMNYRDNKHAIPVNILTPIDGRFY